MPKLAQMAQVLRSKNSGPFEITLDVLFDDPQAYRRVLDSGRLTREGVAALYRIPPEQIVTFATYDAALGIKITYLRATASGTAGDRDVYGAQQHAPLMEMEIPDERRG